MVEKLLTLMKEEVDIQEDGHTDVDHVVRKCKTITEDDEVDVTKIDKSMSPEDDLPSWWMSKLDSFIKQHE